MTYPCHRIYGAAATTSVRATPSLGFEHWDARERARAWRAHAGARVRVPVRLQVGRPVSRSGLWLPILATGFWMGCLLMGGILSGMEYFMTMDAEDDPGEYWLLWTGLPLLLWVVWAVVVLLVV